MKPASSTDACRRCTALLLSDDSRCALCGWPAGACFPLADGEQLALADDEPAAEMEPDDSQLDALSGIVHRRELATEEPTLPDVGPVDVSTGEAAELEAVGSTDDSAVVLDELDPLTAPLETLVSLPQPHGEPAEEPPGVDDTFPASRRTFDVQRLAQVLIGGAALSTLAVAAMETIAAGTTAALVLALVSLAVWTAAVITFLHWVSRTYAHVVLTSPVQPRHGPTIAVAGWMIPVVGVVIGYRVLQDLWAGSDPTTRANPSAPPAKARLIDVWVIGLVTAALFGYVLPIALGGSALWSILSAVGVVTAALALIRVIGTLGSWSTEPSVTMIDDGPAQPIDEGTVTVRVDDLEASLPGVDHTVLTPHGG